MNFTQFVNDNGGVPMRFNGIYMEVNHQRMSELWNQWRNKVGVLRAETA